MSIILSHAALEAAVCPARLIDALAIRHTFDGPLRGGQTFHAWVKLYVEHLKREQRDMDVDEADKIWRQLVPFLSPSTERFVGDVPVAWASATVFDWLLKAEWSIVETSYFLGPARECRKPLDDERWLFRVTPDLMFVGEAHPKPVNNVHIPEGKLQHVVDWKLMWHIDHIDTPEENRQLRRYAAALWDGVSDAVVVWLCFPRRKVWEAAVFYPDQLRRDWNELVVAPANVIAADVLVDERVVGPHCLDCNLLKGCDAALRYPFIAAGVADLDDEGLVTALGVVDTIKAEIEKRLQASMAMRGPGNPIHVEGRDVSITPTERTVWDNAVARSELKALGLADEQAEVAFSCTLAGIETALAQAQWKNPDKGGVKAKAKEISKKMPQIIGQSMDFGRRKGSRGKKALPPPTSTGVPAFDDMLAAEGDDAVGAPVGDEE